MTVGSPSSNPVIMFPTPAIWNMGTPMNPTSEFKSTGVLSRQVIAWPDRLRCVSTAPLGRPVVPEVYMISAGVSSGRSTSACDSPGSAMTSS
ncbi:Uncharacterised protein [Mycobacteroides abscessus subsp. abscessus]|nr:Uncharacterised protein [Mycobacteroides abscessus subsp. abscessus]